MEKDKMLKGYLDEDGRFNRLPGKKQKVKLDCMLEYLAKQFENGKKYSEIEVNDLLNQHHSFKDPATLRRLLYGTGFLDRTSDGRAYWLISDNK